MFRVYVRLKVWEEWLAGASSTRAMMPILALILKSPTHLQGGLVLSQMGRRPCLWLMVRGALASLGFTVSCVQYSTMS